MFLRSRRWCNQRDGAQHVKGPLLALFSHPDCKFTHTSEVRAFVRTVQLDQLGHWMMGTMNIPVHDGGPHASVSMSGTYGADGLTTTADQRWDLWKSLWPLPEDLAYLFWTDDGHNGPGRNGINILRWATRNEKGLTKMRPAELGPAYRYRLKADMFAGDHTGWCILRQPLAERPEADAWEVRGIFGPGEWETACETMRAMLEAQEPVKALALYNERKKEKARIEARRRRREVLNDNASE
jgi:hypothetical protein